MDVIGVLMLIGGLLAGGLAGLWVGRALGRSGAAAELAGARAERDLLATQVHRLTDEAEEHRELEMSLAPLSSSLARVERQVGILEKERAAQWGELAGHLTRVAQDGQSLRETTANLAGALRSSGVRGSWGELQLRRVFEHAGMLPRVDFDTQVCGTNDEGVAVRPDAVVRLPGEKHIVVDAKAPLAALLGSGEDAKVEAAHAKALRKHIDDLAGKRYWTALSPAPEFVICFVPAEGLLAAACRVDPELMEYAVARRVVLATPTTLVAMVRTVALSWQQEALVGNAHEVFRAGRDLYERLRKLSDGTAKLGRSLARSVEDYNTMVATLERQVLSRARTLAELDVTDAPLPAPAELDLSPRQLTAAELVAADEADLAGLDRRTGEVRRSS